MHNWSIKIKLIIIFVAIKVVPLVILGWLAWYQVVQLVGTLEAQSNEMVSATRGMIEQVGEIAVQDSVKALDVKSREAIEQLSTDTARDVANFLYDRDKDVLLAAQLPASEETYGKLVRGLTRSVTEPEQWVLNAAGTAWEPAAAVDGCGPDVVTRVADNEKDWHYRRPQAKGKTADAPLYLEITFVDLNGNEKIKVTSSELLSKQLNNVADKANTWCRAETYFEQLQALRPGEVYVSDLIGPYVGSPIVGNYTQQEAQKRGIAFAPEAAAYAGKENPVGIPFRGLIRWATPVVEQGEVTGYVTMALDHRHLAEFTNYLVPTDERYASIPDAGSGNYAFIWDYKGRSIVHPRHHSIVGYDPATGEPATPWLEETVYQSWQASGLPLTQFLAAQPTFFEPSQQKKPAAALTQAGLVGLDGRYLNFAPQCAGWHELTAQGGSGSFLILWTDLWKITTAATIPYYTGQYKDSPRGFGYVTIGADVDEFHRPANETAQKISGMLQTYTQILHERQTDNRQTALDAMKRGWRNLTLSTMVMVIVVVVIAVAMATFLTRRIKSMVEGMKAVQGGNLDARLTVASNDELGELAKAFNAMTERLKNSMLQLKEARDKADVANLMLEKTVAERTKDLKETNDKLLWEIAEREKIEAKIKYQAYHDALTELPNRTFFHECLEAELLRVQATGDLFALLLLDLDGFKEVNDTYGHEIGDQALREVARRIEAVIGERDIVSRFGGDEFTVLVADIKAPAEAEAMARRIVAALSAKMVLDGCECFVGASVGISICPRDGQDLVSLFRKADAAMYSMKKAGQ